MTIYFSKTTNGFYNDEINTTMPPEKVEVSQAAWQYLISNQGATSQIAADAIGNPVLVDPTQADKVIYTSVGVA